MYIPVYDCIYSSMQRQMTPGQRNFPLPAFCIVTLLTVVVFARFAIARFIMSFRDILFFFPRDSLLFYDILKIVIVIVLILLILLIVLIVQVQINYVRSTNS